MDNPLFRILKVWRPALNWNSRKISTGRMDWRENYFFSNIECPKVRHIGFHKYSRRFTKLQDAVLTKRSSTLGRMWRRYFYVATQQLVVLSKKSLNSKPSCPQLVFRYARKSAQTAPRNSKARPTTSRWRIRKLTLRPEWNVFAARENRVGAFEKLERFIEFQCAGISLVATNSGIAIYPGVIGPPSFKHRDCYVVAETS